LLNFSRPWIRLWFPEDPLTFAGFKTLNQDLKVPRAVFTDDTTTPPGYRYARPSSWHPGGFLLAYCDGCVKFMGENTDYNLYARLMSSNGKKARNPDDTTPPATPLPHPNWQALPITDF
jgi:hypothetical protein